MSDLFIGKLVTDNLFRALNVTSKVVLSYLGVRTQVANPPLKFRRFKIKRTVGL